MLEQFQRVREKFNRDKWFLFFNFPRPYFTYDFGIYRFVFDLEKLDSSRDNFYKGISKIINLKKGRVYKGNIIKKVFDRMSVSLVNDLYFLNLTLFLFYFELKDKVTKELIKFAESEESLSFWRVFRTLSFRKIRDRDFLRIFFSPYLLNWIGKGIEHDTKFEIEKLRSLQMFMNPELFKEVYKKEGREELVKRVEEELRRRLGDRS